jgi:hypothetical protein
MTPRARFRARGVRCMRSSAAAGLLAGAVWLLFARDVRAFCRTTTCPLPISFSPLPASCYPPDFDAYCQSLKTPVEPARLWWRSACVSYDLSQSASRQVPYDVAARIAAASFSKWTTTQCPGVSGLARVSIDVRDLGPVECNEVAYNSDQGNQHVIVFHDDAWPYMDSANTLGLTTVTFNPDTGEIYDADTEINSSIPLAVDDPVSDSAFDLQSIMTHEAGHFLGLAHSGDINASMWAFYAPGSVNKRTLTADDTDGICSIYPPDGTRLVDLAASPTGVVAEGICDPTPRHGFQSVCSAPIGAGCAAAPLGGPPADRGALGTLAGALAYAAQRRRRARAGPAA